jgi:formyltetrahydrofolate deformylase
MTSSPRYVFVATCRDAGGIVAAVSGFLASQGGDILESQQFGDLDTGRFFMRILFTSDHGRELPTLEALRAGFDAVGRRFQMDWSISDVAVKPRVLLAVSRFGHCLNDLLHRWRTGTLPVEIVGVVSNHDDMRGLTEWHGIPYFHLPVDKADKAKQETQFLDLVAEQRVDLVVLARYMQVLSDAMSKALAWRCINIHHSFLPSFKGARPYHQAHARGVKLIGATAHYVTSDLDEGPIIEQDAERVDHAKSPAALVEIGRDIEARVLARAVAWHAERRVLPNGAKTVVFR